MPSRTADAALRDILHHIDLAISFSAGFDRASFKLDIKTVTRSRDAWRSSPRLRADCRVI